MLRADCGVHLLHVHLLNGRSRMTLSCWNCGVGLSATPLPIGRHANCPACYAQLHCCKLCQHYDATRPAQCTEDRAEPPNNKEVANFCDWFTPRHDAGDAARHNSTAAAARAKLDALFSTSSPPARAPTSDSTCSSDSHEAPKDNMQPLSPALSPAERAAAELERLFAKDKPKPPSG